MTGPETVLTSHWLRHPWGAGERRLHWYLLPEPVVYAAVAVARQRVAGPGWDFVGDPWLHCTVVPLTMSADTLGGPGCARLADRVAEAVAGLPPPVAGGVPHVFAEGLVWRLVPDQAFQSIWRAVSEVCAGFMAAPQPVDYMAHITLAYPGATVDAGPPLAALHSAGDHLPQTIFGSLHLLDVWRGPGSYHWDTVAEVNLRSPGS